MIDQNTAIDQKLCVIESCRQPISQERQELTPQSITCSRKCSKELHADQVKAAAKRAYEKRKAAQNTA